MRFTLRDAMWLIVVVAVLLGWLRGHFIWMERQGQAQTEHDRVCIGYQNAMERLRQHEPGLTGEGILPPYRQPKATAFSR